MITDSSTSPQSCTTSMDDSSLPTSPSYLNELVQQLRKDKSSLASQLKVNSEELVRANAAIDEMRKGLRSLQSQFYQLEKENKKIRLHLIEETELNTKNTDEYNKKLTELTDELNRQLFTVEQQDFKIEQLRSEHKISLESSLDDLELFRNELRDTIAELNASYTQLANVEAAHQVEIDKLKQSMSDTETSFTLQITTLTTDKNTLEAELLSEQVQHTEMLSNLKTQLLELQSEAASVMTERTELELKLKDCQLSLNQATQAALNNDTLDVLINTQTCLTLEKNQLAEEITRLTEANSQLSDDIQVKTIENNRLNSDLCDVKEVLSTLQADYSRIQGELNLLQSDRIDEVKINSQLADSLAQLEVFNAQIQQLQQQLTEVEASHSVTTSQLSESLRLATDDLCAITTDYSEGQIALNKTKQQLAEVTQQHQQIVTELEAEVQRLRGDSLELLQQLSTKENKCNEILRSNADLKEELLHTSTDNDSAVSQVKEQLLQLIASHDAMKSDNDTTRINLLDLESRYSEALNELTQAKSSLKESIQLSISAKEQHQAEIEALQTQLRECSISLEESKIAHNAVKKKAIQLKSLYQQAVTDLKASKEFEQQSAQRERDISLSHQDEISSLQLTITQLQSDQATLSESNTVLLAKYSTRIVELEDELTTCESNYSNKIEDLSLSLKTSTTALVNQSEEVEQLVQTIELLKMQHSEAIQQHDVKLIALNDEFSALLLQHTDIVKQNEGLKRLLQDSDIKSKNDDEHITLLSDKLNSAFTDEKAVFELSSKLDKSRCEIEDLKFQLNDLQQQKKDSSELMKTQSELTDVRRELLATLADLATINAALTQAHSQLLVLKELVNLRLLSD